MEGRSSFYCFNRSISWSLVQVKASEFCFSKVDLSTCNEKVKVVEDNMYKLFKECLKCSIYDINKVRSSNGGCNVEMED